MLNNDDCEVRTEKLLEFADRMEQLTRKGRAWLEQADKCTHALSHHWEGETRSSYHTAQQHW